jgi:signal transduction histidine kinase
MSQEVLEQAARPYFTTKAGDSEHRGFGLGLAICRKIALLHGGQLTIASQEGQGTTVQVDLPVRQESTMEAVQAETA